MWPSNKLRDETGYSIIEVLMGVGISGMLIFGGFKMMTNSQKFASNQSKDQSSKSEAIQLANLLRNDWDHRLRIPTPGVPKDGFALRTLAGQDCTANCPRLMLWVKREINSQAQTSEITIQNACLIPTDSHVAATVKGINFSQPIGTPPTPPIDARCSTCPLGSLPMVRVSAVGMGSNAVNSLAKQNRIYPSNASNPAANHLKHILAMQACFSQSSLTSPLRVNLRAVFRDQATLKLHSLVKTHLFPFDNFAKIQLEQ